MPISGSALRGILATAGRQYGLITRSQALRHGLDDTRIRTLLRRGEWRRCHPGVYAVACLPVDTGSDEGRLRVMAFAARLAAGPTGVVCGPTAARLWGMRGLARWDRREIHLAFPGATRCPVMPGVRTNKRAIAHTEIHAADGLRMTTPGRTLRDVVLEVDRETAVSLMDSARNLGLVGDAEFARLPRGNTGRRGNAASAAWWRLSDTRAQSPLETRVRLVCVDAGITPDGLQHPLPLSGERTTLYGDLWWDAGPLLVEADGAEPHSRPQTIVGDRHRQNALLNAYPHLKLRRFGWRDLDHPAAIVATITHALR
ncbi:type IV toxin-antitoxin system AbiEi family antitoxin domain-containing protein [Salinactinospora qingdaonensis]|uniref:AbiEi antitoxin N-terminal domain-containing protein n=1 Tax=Salinactinospora qingdaonensis TaxID=702744 RepID=A0ABP7FSL7_9ACTN